MILDGNSKAGEGKVYLSAREMKIERENTKLQAKLDLAVECLKRIEFKKYGCCNSDSIASTALAKIKEDK